MENGNAVSGFWFLVSYLIFVFITSCSNQKSGDSNVKFNQYFIQGELLYAKHCSNCHQPNGTGLARVYPPLNKSDFMDSHFKEVVCLMKYGKEGEVMVNGNAYNQAMPGVPTLTDIEIAEIATYIYNSWEHKKGIVEVAQVSSLIQQCQ